MINYTNRDYQSIKEELINSISKYTDQWTDFSSTDLGMIFIEFLAGTSAMLNYYIDKEVSETRFMHATDPRNIYSNLELFGYKRPLRRCGVATGKVTANANKFFDSMYDFNIYIPIYSEFTSTLDKGSNKIRFMNAEPILLRQGETDVTFKLIQGYKETKNFQHSEVVNYKLYLSNNKVSDAYFSVVIDDIEWTQVENAFLETQGGQFYSVHRDAFDNIYILFTYNYRDYLSSSAVVTVEYIVTEGDIKVNAGYVDNPLFRVYNSEDRDITKELVFNNVSHFSGGFVDEDLNLSKAKALARSRVPKFLCTLENYEDAIMSFPGIRDVKCVDLSVKGATDIQPYEIHAYILDDSKNVSSWEYKKELQEYIKRMQEVTRSIVVKDAIFKNITIDIEFTVTNERVNLLDIEKRILEFLDGYYYDYSFSRVISRSSILTSIINNFPELKTVNIIEPAQDVFPALGEVIDITRIGVYGSYHE